MKIDVEYLEYMWPMRHFLVTCGGTEGRANIVPVSFCVPVSKHPPLIAIALGRQTHSAELIERGGEFVVNVPAQELKSEIYYCGFHSGRKVDKFKNTGLTPEPARALRIPIVAECVAHMECKLRQQVEAGDKIVFIGEVVEAYADEAVASGERRVEFARGEFPRKIYGTRFTTP